VIEIVSFKNGSSGNSYYVKNEDTKILLECGIKIKEITKKLYLEDKGFIGDCQACVVTHEHGDHCGSIEEVSRQIDTYALASVKNKFNISNYHEVKELEPFNIGSISLLPIPVNHGETQNTAYILKDKDSLILFATDFSLCEYDLSKFTFTELWLECNYVIERLPENYSVKFTRQINTHMSATNLVTHLERMNLINCKRINLIHLSKFSADKKIMKERLSKFNIPIEFAKGGN